MGREDRDLRVTLSLDGPSAGLPSPCSFVPPSMSGLSPEVSGDSACPWHDLFKCHDLRQSQAKLSLQEGNKVREESRSRTGLRNLTRTLALCNQVRPEKSRAGFQWVTEKLYGDTWCVFGCWALIPAGQFLFDQGTIKGQR